MTATSLEQTFQIAVGHHQAGRLAEAEGMYRQILAQVPDHAAALHLLGCLAGQTGHLAAAIDLIGRAVTIEPTAATYHANLGESYRRRGQPELAIGHLRRAIELEPRLIDAHNKLGVALGEAGRTDESITALRRAIVLTPDSAEAHNNLGNALKKTGAVDDAIAAYRRAIVLKPDFGEGHSNLGDALFAKGAVDEAIAAYRLAITLKPDYSEAQNNLGNALNKTGEIDDAIAAYRRAINLKPDFAGAHGNLGDALFAKGAVDDAIAAYRLAITLKPDLAEAHNNLGNALNKTGAVDEAMTTFRRAIVLKPDFPEGHLNLGITLTRKHSLDDAIAASRRAIELRPDFPEAHLHLGNIRKDQGRLDDAIAAYRTALRLKPDAAHIHSNLILALNYHPRYDARAIQEECARWNQQHAEPLKKLIRPHTNRPDPDRRLRIGYVSPDFLGHLNSHFTLPLFSNHDRRQYEIFCYADVARPDAVTERIRGCADAWCSTVKLTDQDLADQVRSDQIDILVDLAMHAAKNRLLLFARKPAPVQVAWLAYPGTTGLSAIDYRLTDPHLDPPGLFDAFYAEESLRLPETFWCYDPLSDQPPVNALPARANGFVTFGCLNNFCKVNEGCLSLWGRVLLAVPQSRMLLLAPRGQARERVLASLEQEGIAVSRVEFTENLSRQEYLKLYHRIDIALDPLPYNGHTTSLDGFWMGVPALTLLGNRAVGRAGWSQLCNLGLQELAAETPEQHVALAARLAGDLSRLQELRCTLRQRIQRSPLMDGKRFARHVEQAYRQMWQRWCQDQLRHEPA